MPGLGGKPLGTAHDRSTPVVFQPQVVMEPGSMVAVDDKRAALASGRQRLGLRSFAEAALVAVALELFSRFARPRRSERFPGCWSGFSVGVESGGISANRFPRIAAARQTLRHCVQGKCGRRG